MASRRGSVYIALADMLIRYRADKSQLTSWKMPFQIRTLTPSPSHTVTRMIATFEDGCALITDSGDYRLLAQGLVNPVATFTPDGSIIVSGEGEGHVYARSGVDMAFCGSFETNQVPIAILPATHGEFAVFDAQGNVTVYRINPN